MYTRTAFATIPGYVASGSAPTRVPSHRRRAPSSVKSIMKTRPRRDSVASDISDTSTLCGGGDEEDEDEENLKGAISFCQDVVVCTIDARAPHPGRWTLLLDTVSLQRRKFPLLHKGPRETLRLKKSVVAETEMSQ
ncbi:unnamed protein product [Mycena citricolor]|uniref:Uncharacterized protein n=1 Tax=Mycena citricolor TaxID=2018698 RepID=A0AAD2HI68_9AGAR|nr:unnamed protein product [Mycena citricolor]